MLTAIFADGPEFPVPANNSYPYRVLSIRVYDGTCRDHNSTRN